MKLEEIRVLPEEKLKELLATLVNGHYRVCDICGAVETSMYCVSCSKGDGGYILCNACDECLDGIEMSIKELKEL